MVMNGKFLLFNYVVGTYKLKKMRLQTEGYDMSKVTDPLYFCTEGSFKPLDKILYDKINSGEIRL